MVIRDILVFLRCLKLSFILAGVLCFCGILSSEAFSSQQSQKVSFISSYEWRADGKGDYSFYGENASLSAGINSLGEIVTGGSAGIYEISVPVVTDGAVSSVALNWDFSGAVTVEASIDNGENYTPVVNGVPLAFSQEAPRRGAKRNKSGKIKWKAYLARNSKLTHVGLVYTDDSSVLGTWGNPELSGFKFRKAVYISGGEKELFNYAVPIKVGESKKVVDCDLNLENTVYRDFDDVRFVRADKHTLLSFWRESVDGVSPAREALFWVKIPQIPTSGILIYFYYGNESARDLSHGERVFSFFDDFSGDKLDQDKWQVVLDKKTGSAEVLSPFLKLFNSEIISRDYSIQEGVIEYRVKISDGAAGAVVGETDISDDDIRVYASIYKGKEHCIEVGGDVKANDKAKLSSDDFYNFRVTLANQGIVFERRNLNWAEGEAKVTYTDTSNAFGGRLRLFSQGKSGQAYYVWVRARQYLDSTAKVNAAMTAQSKEEILSLAEFSGTGIDLKGNLVLPDRLTKGSYVSSVIKTPFKVKVVVPEWDAETFQSSKVIVDISSKKGKYLLNCDKAGRYYSAKGDFSESDRWQWRMRLLKGNMADSTLSVSKFSLDLRSGGITLLSPNRREEISAGSKYSIVWDTTDYSGGLPVDLSYSYDGGSRYDVVARKVKGESKYLWTVPDTPSNKVLVKVCDSKNKKVCDISDDYFSIVSSLDGVGGLAESRRGQEGEGGEITEDVDLSDFFTRRHSKNNQLYDVVIKLGDNVLSGDSREDQRASYKEGDIVVVKAAGHKWSQTEKDKFLIVQMYLTEEEARRLMIPKEIISSGMDKEGNVFKDIVKVRRYKIDLQKLGLRKEGERKKRDLNNLRAKLKNRTIKREKVVKER